MTLEAAPPIVDVATVPVVCDDCGADLTHVMITYGDKRTLVLCCSCGFVDEQRQRRETHTARACGRGGQTSVISYHAWVPT